MVEVDEETHKKLRGRAQTTLTRLSKNFSGDFTLAELKARMSRIDDVFREFDEHDSSLPEELSKIAEFEDSYFQTKSKYQNAIDAFTDRVSSLNLISTENKGESKSESVCNFKLPRLNIPQFSGKYTDWLNFQRFIFGNSA